MKLTPLGKARSTTVLVDWINKNQEPKMGVSTTKVDIPHPVGRGAVCSIRSSQLDHHPGRTLVAQHGVDQQVLQQDQAGLLEGQGVLAPVLAPERGTEL